MKLNNLQVTTGSSVLITLENATDADGDALNITNVASSDPQGNITVNGSEILFTPNEMCNETTVITFDISDNKGGVTPSSVTINCGTY